MDRAPDRGDRDDDLVAGALDRLPVADGAVDVVLGECSICLAGDLGRALDECYRVLEPGGRLALSDVVVSGPLDVPDAIARPLCLTGRPDELGLVEAVENAGFEVEESRNHRADLLAMHDELASTVDYRGLLGLLGDRGRELLDGIERTERAVEDGRVGYVSLVATR